MSHYTALLDANVLYPAPLRDLLMQLAEVPPPMPIGNKDPLCGAEEQIVGFLCSLCLLGFDDVSGRPDFMVSQSWRIAEAAAATHQPTTCRD